MKKMINIEKTVYSPDEAAARLGVSRSTVDRMSKKGAFVRKIKIGEARRGFLVNEVDAWIANLPAASV